MESKLLIERIFEHLDDNAVDKAVMTCLRLSRKHKDYFNIVLFLRELYPNKDQVHDVFFDETQELKDEARNYLWEKTLEKWLEERSVENIDQETPDSEERRNVLVFGIGEIETETEQLEKMIDDLKLPSSMGEYDAAAFTDRYNYQKMQIRAKIKGLDTVKQRVKIRCLNYAIQLEKQLDNQEKSEAFVVEAQNIVNNYFKEHSIDVYRKLQKASKLLRSQDTEDFSLLLTSVRRAMNSVADHFYPPSDDFVICSDGKERKMGNEQYLNRLHQFIHQELGKSTSTELLKDELNYLASFSRRLNDLASKGVHTNVHMGEAKQCYISFFMFLYNLVSRLQYETETS